MFIDFLTLVMINLVAGSVLLAYYLWKGLDALAQRPYAAAFFVTGLIGVITGLQLSFTWPLPGSFNVGYGDAATLFGTVFLGTGLSLWQNWDLLPMAIYSFFAGIDAIIVGLRLYSLKLGQEPLLAAVGFILAGLGGAGADLAEEVEPRGRLGHPDPGQQLAGRQHGLLVAGVERLVGDPAGPARSGQFHLGAIGQEAGRRIGRRAAVDQVAPEGAAVLDGHGAGDPGALHQVGEMALDVGVPAQVGVGDQGAEGDALVIRFDGAQGVEPLQAEEVGICQAARREGHHEIGAAGQGTPAAGLLGQRFQGLRQ